MPSDAPVPLPPRVAALSGEKTRPRRRPVAAAAGKRRLVNQIPDDILHDAALNEAVSALPSNYSFEIHKTIHQLRRDRIQTVALQMPEGLMIYGPVIADILETHTYPEQDTRPGGKYEGLMLLPLLLADVTYGACCIDDFTAMEMGAEMIVHYGHSCLIPVSQTKLKTLYVFVEITIDPIHLALSVRRNFASDKVAFRQQVLKDTSSPEQAPKERSTLEIAVDDDGSSDSANAQAGPSKPTRLALVSTIQFVAAVQDLRDLLSVPLPELSKDGQSSSSDPADPSSVDSKLASSLVRVKAEEIGVWRGAYDVIIPQVRPLSPGEILGCTAPRLDKDVDALIYVGDGRFHLESIMIANPTVPAFRYDPYDKKFTAEGYDHDEMRMLRAQAVNRARSQIGSRVDDGAGREEAAGGVATDADKDLAANRDAGVYTGNEGASGWGVVLGTLGRQGSLSVLQSVTSALAGSPSSSSNDNIPPYLLLLSELSPAKLDLLPKSQISTFVQTSCPRLSIDWGYAFSRPLLTPYEANVALGKVKGWKGLEDAAAAAGAGAGTSVAGSRQANAVAAVAADTPHEDYPMDFYSDDSLGSWTPRHGMGRPLRATRGVASSNKIRKQEAVPAVGVQA